MAAGVILNELQRLLDGNAAFTPASRVVEAVSANACTLRPGGVPHSIADELWHIVYWQDHFLRWAQRDPLPYPERAGLGWRDLSAIGQSGWQELITRFHEGLVKARQIAGMAGLEQQHSSLVEPGSNAGPLTVRELIVSFAVHNAYHLGRIVQLRQMLGQWPPPAGGDTW
jgi:uncharacterized damage-inducible protein DinB